MSVITQASVERALQAVIDPTTGRDLISLNAVSDIAIKGSKVDVTLLLGYPANSVHSAIAIAVNDALNNFAGVEPVVWILAGRYTPMPPQTHSSRCQKLKILSPWPRARAVWVSPLQPLT
jgi:metal-sulfur cluster biosynthetic enzyme